MALQHYRVLLLEDDARLLDRMRDRLGAVEHDFAGDQWRVELLPVRLRIERRDEVFCFTRQTLDELADAVRNGIQLAIVDYGYVEETALKEANAAARIAGRDKPYEDDVKNRILTTVDLARALHEYVSDATVDSSLRRAVRNEFLNASIPMILYSYTSEELFHVYGTVEARRNRTASVFPNFKVRFIDTKYEFYNRSEFDWPAQPSKHDLAYYHFLLSGWLAIVVRQRFFEHLLVQAEASKYLRVKRSLTSVSVLAALGSAVAVGVEWLSARVVDLVTVGQTGSAVVFAFSALALVVMAGLALPLTFERLMAVLLRPSDRSTSDE